MNGVSAQAKFFSNNNLINYASSFLLPQENALLSGASKRCKQAIDNNVQVAASITASKCLQVLNTLNTMSAELRKRMDMPLPLKWKIIRLIDTPIAIIMIALSVMYIGGVVAIFTGGVALGLTAEIEIAIIVGVAAFFVGTYHAMHMSKLLKFIPSGFFHRAVLNRHLIAYRLLLNINLLKTQMRLFSENRDVEISKLTLSEQEYASVYRQKKDTVSYTDFTKDYFAEITKQYQKVLESGFCGRLGKNGDEVFEILYLRTDAIITDCKEIEDLLVRTENEMRDIKIKQFLVKDEMLQLENIRTKLMERGVAFTDEELDRKESLDLQISSSATRLKQALDEERRLIEVEKSWRLSKDRGFQIISMSF